jgi:uncharacterized protein (TIGR03435 family)
MLLAAPAFEVATIKPTPPDWHGGRYYRMESAHQFEARNYTLKYLVSVAWSVSPKAISGGPAWVDADSYDILAKAPGEKRPTVDEQMKMLQSLIVDRFHLTFHREPKEMPVYALTIARGGPKLTESTLLPDDAPEGPPPLVFVLSPQGVSVPARYATIGELAAVMQRAAMDRPVIDQTGLKARYDFTLEWTPDESQFGGRFPPPAADRVHPDLYAALQQQLGLKLEATKGAVQTFVIDQAQRPTEN